jgi:hypothetical protein
MAYIGATPANTFQSLTSQTLTGDGGTSYTLNTSVSTAADIAVFVNNVRQNPNSSYTASGTSLSMSAAVSSSDGFYVVYLGKAVGTINPASGSVGTSQIVDANVTGAKFAADVISAQTELASEPADTDEFLLSDAGVLKRIDYSLIKSASFVGFKAFASANQTISGSTSTQVTFGGELFDVGSNFASNAFVAPSDGKYLFFTQINVGALGSTSADVKFSHTVAGGSTFTGSATRMGPMDTSSRDGKFGLTTVLDMTQNSSVTVFIFLFSGKTLYGDSTGGNSGTFFGGFKIG